MSANSHFAVGDLVWLDFSSGSGHEQIGRRPAVIVSATDYNQRSSLVLACPVTSSNKPWPFKVLLAGDAGEIDGFALVDQLQAVDPSARYARKAGRVSDACLTDIRARLAVVLGLPPEPQGDEIGL